MIEERTLDALLVVSVVIAVALVIVATAALGRMLADLELQIARGRTGFGRIQVWMNIRSQINRVLLGVIFVVINALLLADAPIIYRMWTNRTLWTVLLVVTLAHSIMDWIASAQQVRLVAAEVDSERLSQREMDREHIESYRQMADEAITNLETIIPQDEMNAARLAPVVPEHSSPTTDLQRRTADISTLRARLVAASLALHIAPEPESRPERPKGT